MGVSKIKYIELKGCIVDEVYLRSKTVGINLTSSRDAWDLDTYFLAKFQNNLEAGTIQNSGFKITKFVINRRRLDEITSVKVGETSYQDGENTFTDNTPTNTTYIYSVVPVGENGLEGTPNEIEATTDFVGWYVVDKNTQSIIKFDTFVDNKNPMVNTELVQGRSVIETLAKFPQVYYTEQEYHRFTLEGSLIPTDSSNSGDMYNNLLNNFIRKHRPFLVKGSSGEIYVCDISNVRKTTPANAYSGFDWVTVQVDCVEVMTYADYMGSEFA